MGCFMEKESFILIKIKIIIIKDILKIIWWMEKENYIKIKN